MRSLLDFREHLASLRQLLLWTLLVIPVGLLSGSASALFLWLLEKSTETRWAHPWLLFLLPPAGVLIFLLYRFGGGRAEAGNNLILEQIHEPGGGVPVRMAPLVFIGTILTHLFGGSAGREGTAVQMGGSLADGYRRLFRIDAVHQRMLLMAGVAAGFGSVFGTPLTGAIFAMEVLVIGRIQYDALIPVLVASVVGDMTCGVWGIHHASYHIAIGAADHLDARVFGLIAAAAICFGLASRLFSTLVHSLQNMWKTLIPIPWLRPVAGALAVIGLVYLLGTRDYLGIGVTNPDPRAVTLLSSFNPGGATLWSWWWKLFFTAVTLSCGFKGGEVTPLFFIGAAMGNAFATLTGQPVDLFAGLGFIAVFAGATNTPLACTLMGVELFGTHYTVYFATACFIAYFFSGHSGIYASQRIGVPKRGDEPLPPDVTLREVHALEGARDGFRLADRSSAPSSYIEIMNTTHRIVTREMGKIRIYLTPRDRMPASGLWERMNARPVYREIINAARKDGLQNAAAFMTHYGYTKSGPIQAAGAEIANPNLTLCVELIDHKDALETFCKRHADLLAGRTIVYKHVEHWDLRGEQLVENDASPDEVIDGAARIEPEPS